MIPLKISIDLATKTDTGLLFVGKKNITPVSGSFQFNAVAFEEDAVPTGTVDVYISNDSDAAPQKIGTIDLSTKEVGWCNINVPFLLVKFVVTTASVTGSVIIYGRFSESS